MVLRAAKAKSGEDLPKEEAPNLRISDPNLANAMPFVPPSTHI
jgi:hypothetical protein